MAWIKSDSAIATAEPGLLTGWVETDRAVATAEPGLAEGWVKADSQTKLVNPPGIPEKEAFPWHWVGIGIAALIGAVAAMRKGVKK